MTTTFTIDPAATYTKAALAQLLGVTPRAIENWCKGRRPQLPRPFKMGKHPLWSGKTLQAFMDRRQAEAEKQ